MLPKSAMAMHNREHPPMVASRLRAGAHGEAVLEKWMLRGLAQIKDLAPFENFALFVEDTELATSGERFLAAAPKALASKRFV